MKQLLFVLLISVIFCTQICAEPTIIDNTDPGFSLNGNWAISVSRPGYYGDNYLYTKYEGISETATWSFNVSKGQYEVAAQWSSNTNRATNIKYIILNNGQELDDIQINQKENGGQFNTLGTFSAQEGILTVMLSNENADGFVVADAVSIIFSTLITQNVTVSWDYPTTELRAIGFDIRVNKNDNSLISVSKDAREWAGDVELVLGQNIFDVRTKAENNAFSVWSEPAYYTLVPVLPTPTNLMITGENP